MRKKYQNIGQWHAAYFMQEDKYILRVKALVPSQHAGAHLYLNKMTTASQPDIGLVLRLGGGDFINVESDTTTYLCYKESSDRPFPYSKVIVVSFLCGSKESSFIAVTDIINDENSI